MLAVARIARVPWWRRLLAWFRGRRIEPLCVRCGAESVPASCTELHRRVMELKHRVAGCAMIGHCDICDMLPRTLLDDADVRPIRLPIPGGGVPRS